MRGAPRRARLLEYGDAAVCLLLDDGHTHAGRSKIYAQSDAGIERTRCRHRREQYYCREETHSSSAARVALLAVLCCVLC